MRRIAITSLTFVAALFLLAGPAGAQTFALVELSAESKQCIDCHKMEDPSIYQQWRLEQALPREHRLLRVPRGRRGRRRRVSARRPVDRHDRLAQGLREVPRTRSAGVRPIPTIPRAARILGSLDNVLAEVVEGNHGFITAGYQHGNSAAAVNGCWQCPRQRNQGARRAGKLDAATSAQHRHRGASIRTAPRVRARPATAGTRFPRSRRATPTTAASVTWGRITRRRRSTTSPSMASRSLHIGTR